MDTKSILSSTEVMIGTGIVVAGALALAAGIHDIFALALVPFGVGLILSEIASRLVKAKREQIKVRVRRDNK